MIAALAGRRIDPKGADPPRFPEEQISRVRAELRALFLARRVHTLVSSAASGADLVGLEVASALGIRYRIVLPFEPSTFKTESVVDRGGVWGEAFDRLVDDADHRGDLLVLGLEVSDDAYARASEVLLTEAEKLAQGGPVIAVAVWEKASRGREDHTQRFVNLAATHGYETVEINSSGPGG